MIVEHALLQVKTGHETAFEKAMTQGRPLIAASHGFHSIEVHPCADR